MEVASLVLAIPPILGGIRTCIKAIDDFSRGIKEAEPRLGRIQVRCRLLDAALKQLQEFPARLLDTELEFVTTHCSATVKETEGILGRYADSVDGIGTLTVRNKWKVAWAEDRFQRSTELLNECQQHVLLYIGMIHLCAAPFMPVSSEHSQTQEQTCEYASERLKSFAPREGTCQSTQLSDCHGR
jgi:hypothetical protein